MGALAATTSPLVRRYTLDEFFELEPPREGHYELIAGVLYMVPLPTKRHSGIVSRLNLIFAAYTSAHPDRCRLYVPSAGVMKPADTWLCPDLYLIAPERDLADEYAATADLVVEVSSPSTVNYDRTTKADTYAALGVRELWLVDSERNAIEQRVLDAGVLVVRGTFQDTTPLESAAFPGLRLVPGEVFAG